MAKINTNIMNDIAESLKDSTKNLSKEEKEKVENEVLQEAQQKIENKQKQIKEATSKTSEELNNYANKVEETENSIVSSASKLDSANEMPKITSTIDLNARNEKIAIKREERKNNSTSSTSSNTSKTSDTKVTEKNVTSSNTNTKTIETSKKTNDTKVVETNEIVDKSSTYNIKNTNITAKEKFKEQQLEEKNSKSNTNTTISQNLKNVEKRIDDIDTKNSNNINNSKTLTNSEISNRLGYIPGTELAIQEYSKATSKKIKEAKSVSNTNSSTNLEISSRLGYIPGTELAIQEYSKAASKKIKEEKSVSNTSSSTDEVPQQKSVREYLQAGPQWSYSDKSPINGYDVLTGVVSTTEEEPSFWHKLIYGTPESNKILLENAEIIANDNDAVKEEYYNEHGYVTGGDLAVGAISIVEGVGIFAEDIVKVADIALSGAVTAFGALMALVSLPTNKNSWNEFKIFTEDIWDRTASRISKDHVSSALDSFYNNTVTGQGIKQSSAHFETARSFGVGVGYVGGAVLTGGAIGGLAGAAAGATKAALINGAVYGLARFGGSTGDAIQNGASMEEALLYGGLTGLKEAAGMFIGSRINAVTPIKGALPMTKGAWVNSATHVALDTLDGAASALADPLIQTVVQSIYTPSEEKLSEIGYKGTAESYNNLSFGEKYKVNFEANGGVNNVVGTAVFSGVMSAVFEGVSAAKEINDINKASNVYTKLQENNVALKNAIENTDNIDDEIRSATIDSLTTERSSINESYNSLTSNQKYYFELTATKDAINNNSLSSNGINTIINSSNVKNINAGLSKAEQSSLIKQMDDNQLLKFMSKLDIKDARKLVSNNADYFYNRLSNNTSSTWSNSTSLIESKTDLMVVKNTSNSVDSNNVDIIARNKFESRVGDIEADYNEAIDGIIDEYYTSLRPDVAVPKEKRAISVIQKKYGNNSDYEKTINLYYDELDDSAKKLSDSFLETYTTNYDSPTALTSSLLTKTSASKQQLAKKIEEIDSLIEEFKTKAGYDIFGPHRTNVKVYSGLKEDFMDQYKKVESLESAIKATNKKYVDSVVEKGKELLGESDFEKLDKIFHPTKVEQVTEILEGTAIPRGKKLTTEIVKEKVGATNSTSATSKIGFQFFANKKDTFDVKDMPLSNEPELRIAQEKLLKGENLSLSETIKLGRDHPLKTIGEYECKSNCCYRAIYKDCLDAYLKQGYIGGKGREYEEFIDENGKISTNNSGVDWYLGGYSKKYGNIVIECLADKNYFITAYDGGNHMSRDPNVKHMKSSPKNNPIPVSKITNIFDLKTMKNITELYIPKINEVSSSTSKIGFQFFANKKSSGGILSNIFSKKENATDTFFGDFDSKVDTYGTNQEFINNNVRYVINPSNIPFSRSDFYNYLSSRYPNTSLSELKSEWDGLFTGKITVTNPSDIVSYLASRNQRLGKTISQDIDRAVEEFESMSTKYQSSEYIKLQDYLTSKGMTTSESTNLLTFMNTTGVCSYTDIVNEILTSYRNNPKLFRSQFGYGLYTYTDGKKTLNGNQLLLDLYTYANTHYKGKDSFRPLFRESSDGSLHINSLDTSEQVYLEKDDYKIVENFLKSKDESLSYEYKTKMYKPSLEPDKVKYRIKEALKNGNVGITIYSKSQNEKYANNSNIELGEDGSTILYDPTGEYQVDTESWDEGDSHAMLVTGLTNKGIIVSSWGKKLVIDYEDLANNFYKLRYSNIGGIE